MTLLILFLTGLFAGTVDAIAGGGGLISLPVLLGMGMPPHIAIGTNKLQGTIGTLVAALRFHRHGLISFKKIYIGLLFGLFGSILGAVIGQEMGNDTLRKILPVLLFAVMIYTIFTPRLGNQDDKPRMREFWFYIIFGFFIGLYDGFFGPGTGSLWVFFLAFFLGYNLIKATAYTKVFNLNSSLIATLCFALGGNIDYRIALVMALGQMLGGRLGAYLAIKRGAGLIRPLFLMVVASTLSVMLYQTFSSLALFQQLTDQFGVLPQIAIVASIIVSVLVIYFRRMRKTA